jgi:rhamnosyltransferase
MARVDVHRGELPHSGSVCAVVVTYHPDLDALARLLESLQPQVRSVIAVDNGSDVDLARWSASRQRPLDAVIRLPENRGIAEAQNRGIDWAIAAGADYVLLMDQDSAPATDMVQRLLDCARVHEPVAAVGPFYQDPRQKRTSPFIEIKGLRLVRHFPDGVSVSTPVDYLIASGSLIPVPALRKVGGMREDLFIDYVDIEWGLRARHHGLQCHGVFDARMAHDLGDDPIDFLGKSVPVHSPLRHYYMMRNAILLYRDPRIPLNWKLVDGSRLVLKFVFYSIFTQRRLAHLRMMSLGLCHGLAGKGGRHGS